MEAEWVGQGSGVGVLEEHQGSSSSSTGSC